MTRAHGNGRKSLQRSNDFREFPAQGSAVIAVLKMTEQLAPLASAECSYRKHRDVVPMSLTRWRTRRHLRMVGQHVH
jgi:hypothetical protein